MRPAYLLTHPTNALALAQECLRRDIRITGLLEVRTMGESPPPQRLRETVRQAWAVPVTDTYSSRESACSRSSAPKQATTT